MIPDGYSLLPLSVTGRSDVAPVWTRPPVLSVVSVGWEWESTVRRVRVGVCSVGRVGVGVWTGGSKSLQ